MIAPGLVAAVAVAMAAAPLVELALEIVEVGSRSVQRP
jgi:hypothetical protein